ncbi:MAG: DUF4252 domain-containing protein, partial [Saprospiraceae bacterium]|nr:DUF4252 domain-containing protein [Saprospiraceae bacterium]
MQKLLMMLPLFLLAAGSATAQDDGITRFFNQYVDDERFTVVFVSPKMFQMVAKIETDDEDWNKFRDVVKDLGGLRVLTSDSITNGVAMYKDALSKVPMGARNIKQRLDYLAMYKDALSKVPVDEYSELLTVRDGQENVRIWIKD